MGLAFSGDGTTILGVSFLTSVSSARWDVNTGAELEKHYYLDHAIDAAIHVNTSTLALGRADGKISLWNSESGKKRGVLKGHSKFYLNEFLSNLFRKHNKHKFQGIQALAFSTDGKTLATSGTDNLIKLWDVKSRKKQRTLIGHTAVVTNLSFSINDSTVASGDTDGNIKLWDVSSGSEQMSFNGHRSGVFELAFSPDRQILASAGGDGTVKLWDAITGQTYLLPLQTEHTQAD